MSIDNTPQFAPKRITPTAEQIVIQTAQKKVVLIDANAGAAKTTTLALRLAEALHRGRPPERMLALVFTEAARVALRQRLLEVGVPLGVVKRLTMQGFIVMDYMDQRDKALADLQSWVASGQLKVQEDVIAGLENTPQALIGLLAGENRGKRMIAV